MVLGEAEQMLTSSILVEMTRPAMMTDLLEGVYLGYRVLKPLPFLSYLKTSICIYDVSI